MTDYAIIVNGQTTEIITADAPGVAEHRMHSIAYNTVRNLSERYGGGKASACKTDDLSQRRTYGGMEVVSPEGLMTIEYRRI